MSHDITQAPDFTPGQPSASPFKLDDVLKPITTQFQVTDSLIEGVQKSVNNLSNQMEKRFASIDSHIDTAIAVAEKRQEIRDDHKTNIKLVDRITVAQ